MRFICMKKSFFILTTFLMILSGFISGCSDDNFTTNPSHQLSFSADTLRFDTVFTTLSSATARLMVYNTNNKNLNINTITLKNSGSSGFRVNVDGMMGSRFEQIEIDKKDSLYIFVEVTLDPTDHDLPVRKEDILQFEYNGVIQQIILEAYGQDAIFWRGKCIESDTTLSADKPFVVYDSLVVRPNVRLRIDAGTRLFFHDKAQLIVEGSIAANGEAGNPVVMRGNRMDKLFPNLAYDQIPGQWGGIRFSAESYDNRFTHAEIRNTSWGIRFDSASIDRNKATFEYCKIQNSKDNLLYAESSQIRASNCEFTNSAGALLHLVGGSYEFTHCTLTNLYSFGMVQDNAIHLSNYKSDEAWNPIEMPLTKADFNNCIVWGKRSLEINLDQVSEHQYPDTPFHHHFNHCLLKAAGEDDENFSNTIWNEDPLFLAVGEDYIYDFRIDSLSPARQKGNPTYSNSYPIDLAGNPRIGTPDIGAYQWVEN